MDARSTDTPSVWKRAGEIFAVVGPSVTVLTALLIYFGWVRSHAQARAMGIDVSLFGYTTQDLIINSIGAFYWPLLFAVGATFVWLGIDTVVNARLLTRVVTDRDRRALLIGLAVAAGVLEAAVLAVTVLWAGGTYAPYLAALGFLVVVWAVHIHRRTVPPDAPERRNVEWRRAVESTVVLGVVALFLFWGTSNYANVRGQYQALQIQHDIQQFPAAEIFSSSPLHLSGSGVNEVELTEAGDTVHRYDGLRLLALSNGRYFFLDDEWEVGNGQIVVIPDSESIHVVFGE